MHTPHSSRGGKFRLPVAVALLRILHDDLPPALLNQLNVQGETVLQPSHQPGAYPRQAPGDDDRSEVARHPRSVEGASVDVNLPLVARAEGVPVPDASLPRQEVSAVDRRVRSEVLGDEGVPAPTLVAPAVEVRLRDDPAVVVPPGRIGREARVVGAQAVAPPDGDPVVERRPARASHDDARGRGTALGRVPPDHVAPRGVEAARHGKSHGDAPRRRPDGVISLGEDELRRRFQKDGVVDGRRDGVGLAVAEEDGGRARRSGCKVDAEGEEAEDRRPVG
eukprot:CAMPEP_0172578086 /NCGR_PEP_ID=MMETSP1067-20121228/138560_1 /TAXON_ID=265564 ORGANISM="Thalassiosira punctigera, Strain Tpunct2005C2" /NCGR_SAMPLE_ID=MMETSP1067 /ASSEMBLY_ACC=CAM_ASM_000444 /LENGTH=278 /DNA_ID=CAMNT_0013370779 /DNA_START=47 /DNA_END=880 /DNA_ORIENTATION=-